MKRLKKLIYVLGALVIQLNSLGLARAQFSADGYKYVWYREDGDEFKIDFHLDVFSKKIIVIQMFKAGPKSTAVIPHPPGYKFVETKDYFRDCEILDEKNWKCSTSTKHEYIAMQQGQLIWVYWGTIMRFKRLS